MFSVLGRKEIRGRTGTTLLGESGVNDPVAISLMIGALEFATNDRRIVLVGRRFEFVSEMAVGLALGVLGAIVLRESMRRIDLANETLYPILALAFAGVLYGVTTLAHGSGFLAVFVAGVLFGDVRAPYKGEIERFHKSLASLAEIAVFAVLGLTISLGDFDENQVWLDGLLLAVLLAFVARPFVVGLLTLPMRLRWGERLFVMWGGLRGAVPIMLGTLALLEGHRRRRARLRHHLRRRRVLGARPGHEHPVRRLAAGRSHARHRSRRRRPPRRRRRLVGGRSHAA